MAGRYRNLQLDNCSDRLPRNEFIDREQSAE